MKFKPTNTLALVALAALIALSVWQFWPVGEKITQGLDIKGGLSVTLTADALPGAELSEDTMGRVETILVERVNGFGVSEATVQRQGQNAFLVQLPGVKNAQDALKLLGEPGTLEFVDMTSVTDTATIELIGKQLDAEYSGETTTLPKLDADGYEPFMTGEVITDARVTTDELGNPAVSVS
ncbi:MAG: preprotein translocase subunit SecD family protein, partial [Coriobacteriia bacterium]